MRIKMAGGTAKGDENLCVTCRNAHRRRSAESNEETVYCRVDEKHVRGRMAECSSYDDKRLPTLYAMQQIAWPLTADKKGQPAGFLRPAEYAKAVKEGKVEDVREEPLILPDGSTAWG